MSGQNLDRDAAIEPHVAGTIPFPHAARAEKGLNFIGGQVLCQEQAPSVWAVITSGQQEARPQQFSARGRQSGS